MKKIGKDKVIASIDNIIELQTKKLELLKQHKKGLIQMFNDKKLKNDI
jgi:hypothetical protein